MNTRTQALIVDGALGTLAVAFGVLTRGADPSVIAVGVVALGGGTFVVVLALSEHRRLRATHTAYRPFSFLFAFAVGILLWLVILAGRTVIPAPIASLVLGCGLGLLGYRLVYGFVLPLPDRRHRQAALLREMTLGTDGPDPPR